MKRIVTIDFTRGVVMIIMALDHTRDFMHVSSLTQSPTDLATTTPLLFFTRWITHLCAPVFVFLSGAAVFLSAQKEGNTTNTRNFLQTRGIWLLLLEFTVVNFALWFDLQFRILLFEVIGAIGLGFIILALLLKFSERAIGLIGMIIISTHNLMQFIPLNDLSLPLQIISSLFNPNAFPVTQQFSFIIAYPPVPWLGIMLTGFAAGQLFTLHIEKRKKSFLTIGFIALVLFITLRIANVYGDVSTWSVQKSHLFTLLSFLNVSKYPPSLLFCLVTLGILFLILFMAEGSRNKFIDIVSVYGKVPLFYFLVHLYLLHVIMLIVVVLQGFRWPELDFGAFHFGRPQKKSGVELWAIHLIWISAVAALYPVCKWYGSYKENHKEKKWLRYL